MDNNFQRYTLLVTVAKQCGRDPVFIPLFGHDEKETALKLHVGTINLDEEHQGAGFGFLPAKEDPHVGWVLLTQEELTRIGNGLDTVARTRQEWYLYPADAMSAAEICKSVYGGLDPNDNAVYAALLNQYQMGGLTPCLDMQGNLKSIDSSGLVVPFTVAATQGYFLMAPMLKSYEPDQSAAG